MQSISVHLASSGHKNLFQLSELKISGHFLEDLIIVWRTLCISEGYVSSELVYPLFNQAGWRLDVFGKAQHYLFPVHTTQLTFQRCLASLNIM